MHGGFAGCSILSMTDIEAREIFENSRWPDGAICPYCESADNLLMPDKLNRHCRSCLKYFSVTVRTALHKSHVPLVKWIQGFEFIKDTPDMSGADLANNLGITVITAYRMIGIIREVRRDPEILFQPPRPRARITSPISKTRGARGAYEDPENLDYSHSIPQMRKWFSGKGAAQFHIISLILDKKTSSLKEALRYLTKMKAPAFLLIDGQVSAYREGKEGIAAGPKSAERLRAAGAILKKSGSYYEAYKLETYRILPG